MDQFEYRCKIYPKYTSQNVASYLNLSESEYVHWGAATSSYIYGWLPSNKKAQCLDVACGAGHTIHLLKTNGFNDITGIDICPEQVLTSKKIWSNVFEANAIDYLKQHSESFDLITGFDIIEHFTKNELFEFLEGVYGALRPGGILILQTPNADSQFGLTLRYGDITHELILNKHSL